MIENLTVKILIFEVILTFFKKIATMSPKNIATEDSCKNVN